MSRLFDDAATEFMEADIAPVTAVPFTMACWFRTDVPATQQTLMWVGDKDSTRHGFWMSLTGGVVRGLYDDNDISGLVNSTVGPAADVWGHAAYVEDVGGVRAAYFNGGSKGSQTFTQDAIAPDRVSIGRRGVSTPSTYLSGNLAHAAIWNAALTDAEVAKLGAGACPRRIRRGALVAYWAIAGSGATELPRIGTISLTATGTVNSADPKQFKGCKARDLLVP